MAVLRLSTLGPFTAAHNDIPEIQFPTQKAQALLVYLAVERGRAQRREQLFTMLWPGMPEKSARHNLSQVLYELRQVIPSLTDQAAGTMPLLCTERQTVQLHPEAAIEVDVLETSPEHREGLWAVARKVLEAWEL